MIIAFIWFLSSQSTLPQPKGILGFDKLQHLIAYAVLAIAVGLWASVETWKRRPIFTMLITALITSLFGVIDEIHQYFVPGRDANIWDWIADTIGAFLGATALMFFMKSRKDKNIMEDESMKEEIRSKNDR